MNPYKKYSCIIVLAMACISLHAQDGNTSTKLIDQYKSGSVQGMKFAPANTVKPVAENNTQTSESKITQLRKGTAPGMNFAKGGAAGSNARVSMTPAKASGSFTSDKPLPAATSVHTATPAQTLPTQEDKKAAVKTQ